MDEDGNGRDPDTRQPSDSGRPIDNHIKILLEDLGMSYSRLNNLRERWSSAANEGLLPSPSRTGVFDMVHEMLEIQAREFTARFYPPRKKGAIPSPIRSFEDVLIMTDNLLDIHQALADLERSYWQRLEGYDLPCGDESTRGGALSESGAVLQIYNAADILCASYWDCIFADEENPWTGLTVFGGYHEFMHRKSFIFAPAYVRVHFTQTWIYFAHEVAHQAISYLENRTSSLACVDRDLTEIFSQHPELTNWHSSKENLASETIADIFSTLIGGEQFILALADLKYYPAYTIFYDRKLFGRKNDYPVLLRGLLSELAVRIAWGFERKNSGQQDDAVMKTLYSAIGAVKREDLLEKKRIEYLLTLADVELSKMTLGTQTPNECRKSLKRIKRHLDRLERQTIPSVIDLIIEKRIIPRLKELIKSDFYNTEPTEYYYDVTVKRTRRNPRSDQANLVWNNTEHSAKIDERRRQKLSHLKIWSDTLTKQRSLVDADPRDVIAALSRLTPQKSDPEGNRNHIALCSIFCRQRKRRASRPPLARSRGGRPDSSP